MLMMNRPSRLMKSSCVASSVKVAAQLLNTAEREGTWPVYPSSRPVSLDHWTASDQSSRWSAASEKAMLNPLVLKESPTVSRSLPPAPPGQPARPDRAARARRGEGQIGGGARHRPADRVPDVLVGVLARAVGELQGRGAEALLLVDEVRARALRVGAVSPVLAAHPREGVLLQLGEDHALLVEGGRGLAEVDLPDAVVERRRPHRPEPCLRVLPRLLLDVGVDGRVFGGNADRIGGAVVYGCCVEKVGHAVDRRLRGNISKKRHQISDIESYK